MGIHTPGFLQRIQGTYQALVSLLHSLHKSFIIVKTYLCMVTTFIQTPLRDASRMEVVLGFYCIVEFSIQAVSVHSRQETTNTVKPIWNDHPKCQEKVVFPDR